MVKLNTSSTVPTLWALPAPSGNRSPVYGTFALFFLLNSFLVSAKDQHAARTYSPRYFTRPVRTRWLEKGEQMF